MNHSESWAYDVATKKLLDLFEADNYVTSIADVSPDSKYIVCGAGWRLTTRNENHNDYRLRVYRVPALDAIPEK